MGVAFASFFDGLCDGGEVFACHGFVRQYLFGYTEFVEFIFEDLGLNVVPVLEWGVGVGIIFPLKAGQAP